MEVTRSKRNISTEEWNVSALWPSNDTGHLQFCKGTFYNETEIIADQLLSTYLRSVLIAIITALVIISNLLNMAVIRKTKQMPAMTRMCLISLSSADLLTGLLSCLPCILSSALNHWPYGIALCQVSGTLHSTFVTISIWNLALVSVDRYIAILYPLRYANLITEKRIRTIICCFWLTALVIYSTPVFVSEGLDYYQYSKEEAMCGLYWGFQAMCFFTAGCVPLLSGAIIVVTNIRVMRSVFRLKRIVRDLPRDTQHQTVSEGSAVAKSFRALKVLLLTSATYFCMWGPYVVIHVFLKQINTDMSFSSDVLFTIIWLANSNSFVNVIIYSCFYRSFRQQAWALLTKCCSPSQVRQQQHLRTQTQSRLNDSSGDLHM